MDLDSLNLHDNELNEVASQPMVLSGKPLFDGGSESASGGAPAGATLVSAEETSELVKSLKAVLPVSAEPAVGGDTWGSSGDPSHEFVVPLLPRVRQQSSSARVASHSRSRYGDKSSPPVSLAGPQRSSHSRQSPSASRPRSSAIILPDLC